MDKRHGTLRSLKRRLADSRAGPLLKRTKRWCEDVALRFAPAQTRRHALSGPEGHPEVWRAKREFQYDFLRRMGLAPGDRLLEIGCGTLRGGLPLIGFLEAGNYCGIDAREPVLREAQKELAEAGLTHKRPLLIQAADLAPLDLGTSFRIVWAFAVLQHMSDETLRGTLRCAQAHLEPDGLFFASVNLARDRRERTWREFPDIARPLREYLDSAAAAGLAAADLGPLSEWGHPPDLVNAHHHMLVLRGVEA
jgi:SAM-dependent methyltransferase